MTPNNGHQIIFGTKIVGSFLTELHILCLLKIYVFKFEIVMFSVRSVLPFPISAWVWPKQFIDYFLVFGFGLVIDFNWSGDGLYFSQVLKCASNTSMYAEDAVLDESCEREFIKESVNLVPEWKGIVYILFKFEGALVSETHKLVNFPVLMGASKEEYVLRVF